MASGLSHPFSLRSNVIWEHYGHYTPFKTGHLALFMLQMMLLNFIMLAPSLPDAINNMHEKNAYMTHLHKCV